MNNLLDDLRKALREDAATEKEVVPGRDEDLKEVCERASVLFETNVSPQYSRIGINGFAEIYIKEIMFDKIQTEEFRQILNKCDDVTICPVMNGGVTITLDVKGVRRRIPD